MSDATGSVEVSRRIAAPAARIFGLLASPRHQAELDGSGMLRGTVDDQVLSSVGQTFTMRMHRLGRDYLMINHVVAFERDRLLVWEPAPGDVDTAGGDPARIGVPSGYRWGYRLVPDGDATIVTSIFECGPDENRWILENEDGSWINGQNSVRESMTRTLARLEQLSRK